MWEIENEKTTGQILSESTRKENYVYLLAQGIDSNGAKSPIHGSLTTTRLKETTNWEVCGTREDVSTRATEFTIYYAGIR